MLATSRLLAPALQTARQINIDGNLTCFVSLLHYTITSSLEVLFVFVHVSVQQSSQLQ